MMDDLSARLFTTHDLSCGVVFCPATWLRSPLPSAGEGRRGPATPRAHAKAWPHKGRRRLRKIGCERSRLGGSTETFKPSMRGGFRKMGGGVPVLGGSYTKDSSILGYLKGYPLFLEVPMSRQGAIFSCGGTEDKAVVSICNHIRHHHSTSKRVDKRSVALWNWPGVFLSSCKRICRKSHAENKPSNGERAKRTLENHKTHPTTTMNPFSRRPLQANEKNNSALSSSGEIGLNKQKTSPMIQCLPPVSGEQKACAPPLIPPLPPAPFPSGKPRV